MSQATIVRARQKDLDDSPEWVKCCPKRLSQIKREQGRMFEVYPNDVIRKMFECPWCEQISGPYASMAARPLFGKKRNFGRIMVDGFDFDEGPAEATHDQNVHALRKLPRAERKRIEWKESGRWAVMLDGWEIARHRSWNSAQADVNRINTILHNFFAPNRRAND